jgi:hypothetical protein
LFAESDAARIERVADGSMRGVALSCQCIDCLDRHRKTGRKPSIHYHALECLNGGPHRLSAWGKKPADVSVRLLMFSFWCVLSLIVNFCENESLLAGGWIRSKWKSLATFACQNCGKHFLTLSA